MPLSLMPFQSLIGDILPEAPIAPMGNDTVHWEFGNDLHDKGSDYFNPLIEKHPLLQFSYSVLTTQIVHHAHSLENSQQENLDDEFRMLTDQLINALAMSTLLAHIYCYYLNVPREVINLHQEQKIYRELLARRGFTFEEQVEYEGKTYSFNTQTIRTNTAALNWPRLFAVRIRRIFTTLVPVLSKVDEYGRFIAKIDKYIGPTLNYLAWIFYIPRLFVNIFLFLKHTIPGPWMLEKEKELHWLTRIEAQLQRRWFELGNDAVWLAGNALGCFLLVGALAPVGMYVSVSIFFFDVLMASLRAFIELHRISKLKNEYANLANNPDLTDEELTQVRNYQFHLQQRALFEQKRLFLSIASTSLLFLGMCLALPPLAFNPAFAFVGAILVVSITLATYLAGKWLENQRPSGNIKSLEKIGSSPFGFFGGPGQNQHNNPPPVDDANLVDPEQANLNLEPNAENAFNGGYI